LGILRRPRQEKSSDSMFFASKSRRRLIIEALRFAQTSFWE